VEGVPNAARAHHAAGALVLSAVAYVVPGRFQRTQTDHAAKCGASSRLLSFVRGCVGLRWGASARGPITNQLLCL